MTKCRTKCESLSFRSIHFANSLFLLPHFANSLFFQFEIHFWLTFLFFGQTHFRAEGHISSQAWAPLEASYLEYCHGPTEVRVKAPGLQKGNLKLIPVTDLYKIHARSLTCRTVVTGGTQQDAYYLEAPNRVRDNDVSKWKRESIFAAYWWVSKTHSEKDATMKISTMKIGTFKFPILENIRALKVGDKLQVYQPPSAMQLAKKARR